MNWLLRFYEWVEVIKDVAEMIVYCSLAFIMASVAVFALCMVWAAL